MVRGFLIPEIEGSQVSLSHASSPLDAGATPMLIAMK